MGWPQAREQGGTASQPTATRHPLQTPVVGEATEPGLGSWAGCGGRCVWQAMGPGMAWGRRAATSSGHTAPSGGVRGRECAGPAGVLARLRSAPAGARRSSARLRLGCRRLFWWVRLLRPRQWAAGWWWCPLLRRARQGAGDRGTQSCGSDGDAPALTQSHPQKQHLDRL